jgi:hypothetical protein
MAFCLAFTQQINIHFRMTFSLAFSKDYITVRYIAFDFRFIQQIRIRLKKKYSGTFKNKTTKFNIALSFVCLQIAELYNKIFIQNNVFCANKPAHNIYQTRAYFIVLQNTEYTLLLQKNMNKWRKHFITN